MPDYVYSAIMLKDTSLVIATEDADTFSTIVNELKTQADAGRRR